MNTSAHHVREQNSLLTRPEKVVLRTFAERMPDSVNPDHLTTLGAAGMAIAAIAFAVAPWEPRSLLVVAVALGVNWFGDSLDGTLARTRDCSRPRYGYYLDHVIDTAGAVALVGGMAVSGLMSPMIGLVLLVAYLAVAAETYLATHAIGVFRMSYGGFGPTEMRIVLAVGAVVAYIDPFVSLGPLGRHLLFDVGALVATALMAATFVFAAVTRSRALYRAEPLDRAVRRSVGTETCADTSR